MKKSAKQLGDMIGKTAQDVNTLLENNGFLEGNPGNYKFTEKGMQYGEEIEKSNGYGGYANRNWNFKMWDEEVAYQIGDPDAHAEEVKKNRKKAGLD